MIRILFFLHKRNTKKEGEDTEKYKEREKKSLCFAIFSSQAITQHKLPLHTSLQFSPSVKTTEKIPAFNDVEHIAKCWLSVYNVRVHECECEVCVPPLNKRAPSVCVDCGGWLMWHEWLDWHWKKQCALARRHTRTPFERIAPQAM